MKLFAAMMILCASFAHAQAQRFDYESLVGVADVNKDGKLCLIIPNSNITNGVLINLIVLSNHQSVVKARIKEKLGQSCSHNPDMGNASFYLLQLDEKNKTFSAREKPAAAIAIVSSASIKVEHGKASLDLDKDGRREFFRECTSKEGVHLTIWNGRPLEGKRRWHFYYYLGYDLVPSCKRKDYQ